MRTTVPAVDNARLLSALPAACMLSHPLVASDALGGCALQDLKILPRSSAFAVRWPRSRVARGALWSAHSTGSCYGICGVLAFPSVRDPSLLCFCMCGLPKVLTHAVYTCERHVGPKLLVHEVHVGIPEKGFQDRHGPCAAPLCRIPNPAVPMRCDGPMRWVHGSPPATSRLSVVVDLDV